MRLSLLSFTSLVQGMAAAVQAATDQVLDLTVGSTLRAILEANASIALWMQWLILQVLRMTRAATSNGTDLDSWVADFSLIRLPAGQASGVATFSRFNSTVAASVPIGALVRTSDGIQIFAVTQSSTTAEWSQSQTAYVMAPGVSTVNIPVQAQNPGTVGNVQAGSISVLASALPGIDGVVNETAISNGTDAESDVALRLRFQSFIGSLSRATPVAVGYAINTVQQGLHYTIQENVSPSGAVQIGNFVIVVDDGSGYPSGALLSMVQQAVEAVRPVGSTFAVFAPTVTQVDISLTISTSGSTGTGAITLTISAALTDYVNSLPIGASLPVTMIAMIAYTSSPSVDNVTAVTLNGQISDMVVQQSSVIKVGTIAVG